MKYPKVISLAVGLVLIGLGAYGIGRSVLAKDEVQPTLAAGSFLQLDYIAEDAAFRAELDQAVASAERWSKDSELIAITMQFDGGLNHTSLTRYAYIFSSATVGSHIVNNQRIAPSARFSATTSDIFGELEPMAVVSDYLKINFAQALEIVEREGGSAFRADHSGNYQVSLLLIQPERGVLSWIVAYRAKSGGDEALWRVNAASGLVEAQ